MRIRRGAAPVLAVMTLLMLAACGASSSRSSGSGPSTAAGGSAAALQSHPQAIEPSAGAVPQVSASATETPVGDPNAHAVSLAEVRRELKLVRELN
ncbi:MAG: hypothetical protein JO039_18595, partial [Solirubrobacterales bacterium]|nr:hypothetical protein [Solirubrobacterales bacterium]